MACLQHTPEIREHQPHYSRPTRKPQHWFSPSLRQNYRSPRDFLGLEDQTLLTLMQDLTAEVQALKEQITTEKAKDCKASEVRRLRQQRSFLHRLISGVGAALRHNKQQRQAERDRTWPQLFIRACKEQLSRDQFLALTARADELMQQQETTP